MEFHHNARFRGPFGGGASSSWYAFTKNAMTEPACAGGRFDDEGGIFFLRRFVKNISCFLPEYSSWRVRSKFVRLCTAFNFRPSPKGEVFMSYAVPSEVNGELVFRWLLVPSGVFYLPMPRLTNHCIRSSPAFILEPLVIMVPGLYEELHFDLFNSAR